MTDVSIATAAMIFNSLPELLTLPSSECHRRIALIVEAGLAAYEASRPRVPEPSRN